MTSLLSASTSTSTSTAFTVHEENYFQLTNAASHALNSTIEHQRGELRKNAVRQCEKDLEEAAQELSRMMHEASRIPIESQPSARNRITLYEKDLLKLRKQLALIIREMPIDAETLRHKMNANRDQLFGDIEKSQREQAARTKLLLATDQLGRSGTTLKSSIESVRNSEHLGLDILDNLSSQRDQLVHSRDAMHTSNRNVDQSNRVLRVMQRRITTNKCIFALIVVILMSIVLAMAYVKWGG